MLVHIIDFLVDYFTNLNVKKVFGGVLVLAGLSVISRAGLASDTNITILLSIIGIVIGGVGFVIIYYDMAKDKNGGDFDELGTLVNGYKQGEEKKPKLTGWHMPDDDSSDQSKHL
jgi:hypothetical protein